MTQQFTASEVHAHVDECNSRGAGLPPKTHAMLRALADLLEAREKAVPVGYISADDIRELDANREDDAERAEAIEMLIASRPFASNHTAIYTHPDPADAKRLAEPYYIGWCRYKTHDGRATTLHLCDSDDEGAFRIYRHAHSAQSQPPAASVPDGFVFERVNMGRGNERYVGLADGSEGTTVQEDGDGPGDTRSRLLWRIADAMLAAQENPNG